MQLKELVLTSSQIAPGEVLQAIENAIPSQEIAQAIKSSRSEQQRKRVLPTHLVVALVIAMSLWSKDSIEDVFKNLVHGLSVASIRLGQRCISAALGAYPNSIVTQGGYNLEC